jgi:hypothetical protein
MPRVGFECTIIVFGQVKTVHALHRAATVIGIYDTIDKNLCSNQEHM